MSKGLYLITALSLGAAAIYFLDEKKGKKRRAEFRKKVQRTWEECKERAPEISRQAGNVAREYLNLAGEKANRYGKEFGSKAQKYAREAGLRAREYMKSENGWHPSARMMGALGSALMFYGAGRPGLTGTLLRTLSLGMFTRALMASR